MRYQLRIKDGKVRQEYVYGDPVRVVRFCLGPFQDAVLLACTRVLRSRNRPARRVLMKAAAIEYGVDYAELQRWRDQSRKVAA